VNESFKFELQSNTQTLQQMGLGGNVFSVAGKLIQVRAISAAAFPPIALGPRFGLLLG